MWGAIANAILTVILINTAGLYAAAFGSMVGNAIIWMTRIVQTRKYFNIKMEWTKFIFLLVLCAAMIVAVNVAGLIAMIALEVIACVFFLLVNKDLIVLVIGQITKRMKK